MEWKEDRAKYERKHIGEQREQMKEEKRELKNTTVKRESIEQRGGMSRGWEKRE